MAGSVLGEKVLRKEDPRFLTEGGMYLDDLKHPLLEGAAHVVYARSQVAHGVIVDIDISEAENLPGVIALHTAETLGLEPAPSNYNPAVARTLLARQGDKVRWVGEPVVAVVAETYEQATDAAQAVFIDIDPLPAVVDLREALTSDTHLYEAAGGNAVFDSTVFGAAVNSGEDFFADCEVVVTVDALNQRVAPCPMEPRAAAAAWQDGRLHEWVSTQHAQGVRAQVAKANGVTKEEIHIITPDVGGGFGAKIGVYSEELLVGPLARAIGRPVRFRETRSESMMNLGHGRAQFQTIKIGGRRDGRVTHFQLEMIQDSGGYCEVGTILGALFTRRMASGVYAFENVEAHCTSVVTNTTPTVAYRGAGRPEATAATERAMDVFALEIGMDPVEVRRINLIPEFHEPYTTAIGEVYDCGDFEGSLDRALAQAGYDDLRAEQRRRREAGEDRLLGIGVSAYVEITGGAGAPQEDAKIVIHADGSGTIYTGTSPHGQGHETAWAQIASASTGIDMSRLNLVWGDTDLTPVGGGTMGSRSLQQGGLAVHQAAAGIVEQGRRIAASLLEADEIDIVLDTSTGTFHVAGTPAVSTDWAAIAAAAGDEGLVEATTFKTSGATYPFGAHVAVVEVDAGTGKVTHLRHIACDDAGTMVNPMLLAGQVHGGIAQGTAQALYEEVRYDEDGNPITSNLAEYAMVTMDLMPQIERVPMETATWVNELGAKGIGESGTIGSTPAVHSAVVDALSHLGVRHIDMPCTPEKVWRAIAGV
ncbi:MAG: xanthine dehydrogenase family protein molybdopterin-binding subunit [Ilumatobacteraceae bacterium]|nr:xanthine dehydrogenase family protein molybdopterin-binding subunit [Ilumatobacteraceae bacterium]